MSVTVNNLILEVTDTLTNYAEGKLAYNDALKNYKQLIVKYKKIEKKLKTKDNTNHIEGLCYYCNTENYSLLSGIYKIEKQEIYSPVSFGDTSLDSVVMNIIIKNADNFQENTIHKLPSTENSGLSHDIYIFPIDSTGNSKSIFASVSSSAFFSEDKFRFIGRLIRNIFTLFSFEAEVFENDYFCKISNEINEYIKINLDENYFIRVTLFVFTMLNKVFDHMGDNAFLEINDYICRTLKSNFKHYSKCYSLSIRDYIIIEKISRTDSQKDKKVKPEFSYNNVNMTYQSLKFDIENQEPGFSLWDKILTFENYLMTGDIIR